MIYLFLNNSIFIKKFSFVFILENNKIKIIFSIMLLIITIKSSF